MVLVQGSALKGLVLMIIGTILVARQTALLLDQGIPLPSSVRSRYIVAFDERSHSFFAL